MSLIELNNEHGGVTVTPKAGAALRSLRVNIDGMDHELLSCGSGHQFDETSLPSGTGSFIMAPWVNRIAGDLLVTGHGEFKLPAGERGHVIHGTVRGREWDVTALDATSVVMQIPLVEPWPFKGHVVYRIALDGASVRQVLEVHAADGERCFPAGVGWHPWFRRSLGKSELNVQADVIGQWELDAKFVPSGKVAETDASRKINKGGSFEIGEVDDCYMLNGERSIELTWPELKLRMDSSPEIGHVMVYSPKDSICVEPQTTAVNAFQLEAKGVPGNGTRFVSPGNSLIASTTWSWSQG